LGNKNGNKKVLLKNLNDGTTTRELFTHGSSHGTDLYPLT